MCMRQMMFAMDDVGFLTQGAVSVGIIFFMAVIGYQILKMKRSVLKKEGEICILNLQISVKKLGADEVLSGITLSMEKWEGLWTAREKAVVEKSMLMRVICGLVLPTVGEVKIDGKILGKEFSFPPSVGVFIEKPGFLDSYSGFQNLMMLASIKGQISGAEVKDVLKRVGLQDVMYKKYRKYSLGMKQKLGIAAAIMEKPELIILDEPSNALDEKSEEILWQIVGEEKERGALILISCHTTETLEKVSDEIFRMDMGQIKEHMTV